MVAHDLAVLCGIHVPEAKLGSTFLIKRFDREGEQRIHLRNHGFILATEGWKLSPAFEMAFK